MYIYRLNPLYCYLFYTCMYIKKTYLKEKRFIFIYYDCLFISTSVVSATKKIYVEINKNI